MYKPYKILSETIRSLLSGQSNLSYDVEVQNICDAIQINFSAQRVSRELINGTRLQNSWFPVDEIGDFDVFLSHSHQDIEIAKCFASYLRNRYGIRTFIDSCFWGNIANLQRRLDVEFSRNRVGNYSYGKVMATTSITHAMLSMALMKMMDKCETVIFINSENSTSVIEGQESTFSPWLYEEIEMMQRLKQHIDEERIFDEVHNGQRVYFEINTSNIEELSVRDFSTSIMGHAVTPRELMDRWHRKYER